MLFVGYIAYVVAAMHRVMNPVAYLPQVDERAAHINPIWKPDLPVKLACYIRLVPWT